MAYVSRRDIWLWLLAFAASIGLSSPASAAIAVLAEVIEKIGSIVKSVADGIEAAYKTGMCIVDDQRTRGARAALRQVLSDNNKLIFGQAPLLWQIQHYKVGDNWGDLQLQIRQVAYLLPSYERSLEMLADHLPPELGEQISQLPPLYEGRIEILSALDKLPPPSNEADISSLHLLGDQWNNLHQQLIHLNVALSKAIQPKTTR